MESALTEAAGQEMIGKLKEGTWRRAADAQRWLKEEHKVEVALRTVYKYLGKMRGAAEGPAPIPRKKRRGSGRDVQKRIGRKATGSGHREWSNRADLGG